MLQILSRWYRGGVSNPEQIYSNTSSLSISPFPEEPLALSAQEGFGFFLGRSGLLLNKGRYEVLRKLGKGKFSSTWLACDSQAEERLRYCAIKILTVYATTGHYDHNLLELEIMQTITSSIKTPYLPRLRDHFETEGPHGRHLCLVLPALSDSVSNFRLSAPSKILDPPKVKILIVQIVEALVGLHSANIIHTDIKPDNVLFNEGTDTQTLNALLDRNPPIVDGEFELNSVKYPIMRSQPIPHPFLWNDPGIVVETYPVCLADFGSAQWVYGERPTRTISAPALRAPEVILGADYGTQVDIWAIGCMTFELLTGRWLFKPTRGRTWRVEDDHLAKMMELTGHTFGDKTLARSRKRDEYFDKEGKLLRIGELFPRTLEQVMINYGLPEQDAASAAVFIRACLQLNAE